MTEHRNILRSYVLKQLSNISQRWPEKVQLEEVWSTKDQETLFHMCNMRRIVDEGIIGFDSQTACLWEFVQDCRAVPEKYQDTMEPANHALALRTIHDMDTVMENVSGMCMECLESGSYAYEEVEDGVRC